MNPFISGNVFKVGDNINTDLILPARYLDLYEPKELGPHAFEGMGLMFVEKLKGSTIVVGGENFGLGSAREQAPNAMKGAGIQAVIAKSFARIFYRNTLNVGVAAIECPEAAESIEESEIVSIHLESGTIQAGMKTYRFASFSGPTMDLLRAGGMVPLLKKKLVLS